LLFISTALEVEAVMKTFFATLLAAFILAAALSPVADPAFALGNCGPNRHRNGYGQCVFGGQNQNWCARRTGHPATRMPNGTMRCL
jgi:hypothetical protein